MKQIDKTALFRLSVIGQLVSRESLQRGQLQQIIRELAQQSYVIPGSCRTQLGEKTIQAWYYNWQKGGIEALVPQIRADRGLSKLTPEVQEAIPSARGIQPPVWARTSTTTFWSLYFPLLLKNHLRVTRSAPSSSRENSTLTSMRSCPSAGASR